MNKKSLLIVLGILILPIIAFWGLTFNKSDVAIANNGKPQIIKFTSTMCLECKEVNKIFKELLPTYGNKYGYSEIIVDSRSDMDNDLIEKYNVTLVPTVILLNSDGTVNKRIEGAIPKKDMDKCIKGLK